MPLALDATGASFTTGNLHKWVCAPKGAGFLHVRRDWQEKIRPTVISHGANSKRSDRSRFQLEFDWVGTQDPTPYLCVPAALDFMGSLVPGVLLEAVPQEMPCPPELLGAMASVFVSGELGDRLFREFKIEVPVILFAGRPLVRISMQRHVRPGEVAALASALRVMR